MNYSIWAISPAIRVFMIIDWGRTKVRRDSARRRFVAADKQTSNSYRTTLRSVLAVRPVFLVRDGPEILCIIEYAP